MRTERRHELEENILAQGLISVLEKIRPYQNAILIGLVGMVVLVAAYQWITRRSSGQAEAAWNEVFANMSLSREDPSALEKAAENFAGTEPGQWAALLAAEAYLAKACDAFFQNKTEAREYLHRSRDLFQRVLTDSRNEVLRERATFGLARADETAGDLDNAIESWSNPSGKQSGHKADRGYQGVLNLWPEGAYAKAAQARLNDLQRYTTKKFYDEFGRWEPRPLPPESFGPSAKGKIPADGAIPEGPLFTPGELVPSDKPEKRAPSSKETPGPGADNPSVPPSQEKPSAPPEKPTPPP